ncbi:MAG TPA: GNAT family N-acetyltransferase [Mycobacteriales bacterium]|nr:GNAT family N-acetyltransferase [Mycobacteriales bacterium]
MGNDEVEVRLDADRHRFEIFLDGELSGHSRFQDSDGTRTFIHTEIDPNREGHGLGGRLVREALDQTKAAGMRVVPQCPFVRSFIEDHPEYADLVDAA